LEEFEEERRIEKASFPDEAMYLDFRHWRGMVKYGSDITASGWLYS